MYRYFNKVVYRFPYYSVELMNQALEDNDYFKALIQTDAFRKAILFASPVLFDELDKYLDGKLNPKDMKRVKNSLVRYLSRMSTRCTPFALFASCATGVISDETKIELADRFETFVRFDMLYLCNLAQKLEKQENIKRNIRYYPNTTIYFKADKLRYIEYKFGVQSRSYQLVEITKTPYLVGMIQDAQKGIAIDELAKSLREVYDVDNETAVSFIDQIIESQILVSEIDPVITGPDFFGHVLSVVRRLDRDSETSGILETLKNLLDQLNRGEGSAEVVCNRIEEEVKKLDVPYQKKFLLQVDSIRKTEKAEISKELAGSLRQYMEFLNKLTPRYDNGTLTSFVQAFYERYEEQEVPLLEAMDPELGIGYPVNQVNDMDPLLAGLFLPGQPNNSLPQYRLTPLQAILQKKLVRFNPDTEKEIVIEDEDVKHLTANWEDLPATMSTMFSLLGTGSDTGGYLLQAGGFNGCSAANLLGRFAYCNEGISELVNDITREEKRVYSDRIVAEISHIPDSRVGNILARPYFRDYEIVYLANSVAPKEQVIYPSDLMLSVRNNQVMLRSKSLNKYIVPRLSTAHNFSNNPTPVYRFLCELQSQGQRGGLFFSWGELEQQLAYLPRVRYRNIICALAKWGVDIKDLKPLMKEENDAILMEEVNKWRAKYKLPRYVDLADGDNKLFVDLENLNSIHTFISVLANRNQVLLEEFIEEDCPVVKDSQGNHYTNECIVSFYKPEKTK